MRNFINIILSILMANMVISCGNHASDDKASGRLFVTSISNVVENPQKYANEPVTLYGEVSGSVGLFRKSVFTLTDNTGSIKVYCPCSMAPSDGQTVKIKGQVHQVYRIKGKSFIYIKQLKDK